MTLQSCSTLCHVTGVMRPDSVLEVDGVALAADEDGLDDLELFETTAAEFAALLKAGYVFRWFDGREN